MGEKPQVNSIKLMLAMPIRANKLAALFPERYTWEINHWIPRASMRRLSWIMFWYLYRAWDGSQEPSNCIGKIEFEPEDSKISPTKCYNDDQTFLDNRDLGVNHRIHVQFLCEMKKSIPRFIPKYLSNTTLVSNTWELKDPSTFTLIVSKCSETQVIL